MPAVQPILNRLFVIVALCTWISGCASLTSEHGMLWLDGQPRADLPDRILPVWADAVLHQPGKSAVRGFGGRLYFYKDGQPDPMKVKGSVTVYLFDGENNDLNRVSPLKKYIVTADQFAAHHSKTSLGHSYSIWVPWGPIGGPARTFGLIVRFDGDKGGTVLGQPAKKLLPGVKLNAPPKFPVHQASHTTGQLSDSGNYQEESTLSSDTINLSPSFRRRLMNGEPEMQTKATEFASPDSALRTNSTVITTSPSLAADFQPIPPVAAPLTRS